MGSVAIDTKKKEREFEHLTLSDENVVKYLILYRSKVDMSYGANTNIEINSAGDTFDFNQEIIALYTSLDKAVEHSSLTSKQSSLLEILYKGNTVNDAGVLLGQSRIAVFKMLERIVKKIVDADRQMWYYTMGNNGFILSN
ncbi:sigma factor [Bacillus phage PBC2]|uniref:Uncharacterized protein n=1 Tax=Bacillus phage PBC2 TaxID=1675029 RepID=A0A218KCD3_9CAUD|nr:sigma factor [Bacillus phage PBC2]AKQ08552.1 hypothetical protein PBC2_237 [Bacillus phage PBC2]